MTSHLRFPQGLYGITPEWDDTGRLLDAIEQAAKGGMTALQWRRKTASPEEGIVQARKVRERCRELGVLCIVNDDWRLATIIDADGVHLGRDDGSIAPARTALGPDKLIGSSCYDDLDRARQALASGADYIAFGAVYTSSVKPGAVRASLDVIRAGRQLVNSLPATSPSQGRPAIVAIGGITPDNAAPVIQAGADSLALITGLFEAPDIRAAAERCQALFALHASSE